MINTNGKSSGIRLTKKFDDGVLNVYLTSASLKISRSASLGPGRRRGRGELLAPPSSSVKWPVIASVELLTVKSCDVALLHLLEELVVLELLALGGREQLLAEEQREDEADEHPRRPRGKPGALCPLLWIGRCRRRRCGSGGSHDHPARGPAAAGEEEAAEAARSYAYMLRGPRGSRASTTWAVAVCTLRRHAPVLATRVCRVGHRHAHVPVCRARPSGWKTSTPSAIRTTTTSASATPRTSRCPTAGAWRIAAPAPRRCSPASPPGGVPGERASAAAGSPTQPDR